MSIDVRKIAIIYKSKKKPREELENPIEKIIKEIEELKQMIKELNRKIDMMFEICKQVGNG